MTIRTALVAACTIGLLTGCSGAEKIAISGPLPTGDAADIMAPAETFGDGTHEVIVDIKPGKYRTPGPRDDMLFCFWHRLSDTSGERGDIIASAQTQGPTTVTIKPGDKAFHSEFCQPWQRVGEP